MDSGSNVEEPKSWDELYTLDLMPSELFLKFRKEIQGFRVGVNMEFYNAPSNEFESKLVLKPLANDRQWKFMYAPLHHDVRLMSKKIPVTNFLNLQVGVGHSFGLNSTGLNWKLSTCLGGDGLSRIRNKTSLGLCPGVDLRFAWKADYVLPEFDGALGTGKPLFNMNSGSLHASLDRVELILTHTTEYVLNNQYCTFNTIIVYLHFNSTPSATLYGSTQTEGNLEEQYYNRRFLKVPEDVKSQPTGCLDIESS